MTNDYETIVKLTLITVEYIKILKFFTSLVFTFDTLASPRARNL